MISRESPGATNACLWARHIGPATMSCAGMCNTRACVRARRLWHRRREAARLWRGCGIYTPLYASHLRHKLSVGGVHVLPHAPSNTPGQDQTGDLQRVGLTS